MPVENPAKPSFKQKMQQREGFPFTTSLAPFDPSRRYSTPCVLRKVSKKRPIQKKSNSELFDVFLDQIKGLKKTGVDPTQQKYSHEIHRGNT